MTKYIIATLLVLSVAANSFAEPIGVAFLKIPNGAAEISLGMSGVSHTRGSSAAYWNPARVGIGGSSLGLQFFRSLGDGRGTFGTGTVETTWGGLSVYLFDLGIDGFEARNEPGPPAATFTVHFSVLALGASIKLPWQSRIGIAAKGYLDDFYGNTESSFPVFDAGYAWSSEQWSVGTAVANFSVGKTKQSQLPTTLRAGVSRKDRLGDYSLQDIAEYSVVRNLKGVGHIALEGGYRDRFFLRGGAAISGDYVRPTFGLGVEGGPYRIDAAIALYDEALGSTWRIGLGYGI